MKITEDMIKAIATPAIYKRGVEFSKEGRVHIRFLSENSVKAVVDSEDIYNVSITEENGKITEHFCTCPYYQTMGCSCKHIVATLKMCREEMEKGRACENENDRIASFLCDEYLVQTKKKERIKLGFRLNIYTGLERCSSSVSIKAGISKPEPITGISTFIDAVLNEKKVILSKHRKLSLNEYAFGEEEAKIIDILCEIAENKQNEYLKKEEIYLGDYTLKRILPILRNLDCEYRIDGANSDLMILDDDPDILVDVNAVHNKVSMVVSDRGYALTRDGEWFLYEEKLYKTSLKWQSWFMPIYRGVITSRRTQLDFSDNNAVNFVTNVLPSIEGERGVVLSGFEESVINTKPRFEIFIERSKNGILATPLVHYGLVTLKLWEDIETNGKILIRNKRLEEEVFGIFSGFTKENDRFFTDDNDEIFKFLNYSLPMLKTYADIIFDNPYEVKDDIPITSTLGYLKEVNLLEIGFESELSDEEVAEILSAVRLKKGYFRHKNGDFYRIHEDNILAAEVINSMGFKAEDIKNRKKQVNVNNAFYLSGLKKDGVIDTDKSFDLFIEEIKNVHADVPKHIDSVLRGYQKEGVEWLTQLSTYGLGGILADDMGLGKTLQVIAFVMSTKRDKPVLVVTPSSLTYNWQNEIARFAPEAKSVIIEGVKEERAELLEHISDYDFIITSYSLMRRDMELYNKKEFSYFFIDEAQYIKNPGTINAKSVKKIKAGGYFALTGTPIENSLNELWSIFDFIMKGYLYSNREFMERYQKSIMKEENQAAAEELKRKIQPFILRRMKKDVLTELPEKIENTVYSGLESEQKKMYEAYLKVAKNEIQYMYDIKGENHMRVLGLLMRLRQICCHPKLFDANYKGESGKLQLFLELVKSGIEAGHRILVFSQFTSMLAIIKESLDKLGIGYFYLDGATYAEDRIDMANRFNKGEREVFLISLKAGGTGLNLIGADMVIHYDPWWNPAVMDQASDRAYRIGQTKAVQVIKLAAKGTIEEQIIKLQEKKRELADDIIKENSRLLSGLSKEEILSIFN